MTRREFAQRIAAWAWAAETLGIEVTRERLRGLVDVTRSVLLPDLQPSIADAIATEERGFMPAPGLVMRIAKKRAAQRHDALQAARRERDRSRALLEADASPASAERINEIRERIAALASRGSVERKWSGWRPADMVREVDDASGLAAARAARGDGV